MESDKERMRQLEEAVLACKEQLSSCDQINMLSQAVIEKLEREVSEYKFELETAKDIID